MKTRRIAFLSVSFFTLILVMVFFVGRNRPTAPSFVSDAESAAATETASPSAEFSARQMISRTYSTYCWRVGEQASWQFDVSLGMASAPEKISAGAETRVDGRLQLVVLDANSERITLAAGLSETRFEKAGQRVQRFEEFFNATPAILILSPVGKLLEVALPRQVAAEDRNLLRLVYGWEVVARNAATYQETDYGPDNDGTSIHAAYRRLDDDRIRKTRRFQTSGVVSTGARQSVVGSQFTASIGRLWVAEMSGWEDTALYLNDAIFAASRISVAFQVETNSFPLTPPLLALLANPGAASAFRRSEDPPASGQGESISQAVRRDALSARWGSVPFEQVLAPILARADGGLQELAMPLRDFEEWLSAHPDEGPTKVLQSLQLLGPDQAALSGLLVNGLAEADTPQARQALTLILSASDAFQPSTLLQTAVAGGDLGEKAPLPLRETLAGLLDSTLSDGSCRMSDTALFAFARIAKDDAAAREVILQRIVPWLEPNAAPHETVKAFSVLANAVVDEPRLRDQAAAFLRSADADIRLAAVEYLGSLPASVSSQEAIVKLASDPDIRIQAEVERLRTQPGDAGIIP